MSTSSAKTPPLLQHFLFFYANRKPSLSRVFRDRYEQEHKLEILLGKIPHLTSGLEASEIAKYDAKEIIGEYGSENADAVYKAGDAFNRMREEKHKLMVEQIRGERDEWIKDKKKLKKDLKKVRMMMKTAKNEERKRIASG